MQSKTIVNNEHIELKTPALKMATRCDSTKTPVVLLLYYIENCAEFSMQCKRSKSCVRQIKKKRKDCNEHTHKGKKKELKSAEWNGSERQKE